MRCVENVALDVRWSAGMAVSKEDGHLVGTSTPPPKAAIKLRSMFTHGSRCEYIDRTGDHVTVAPAARAPSIVAGHLCPHATAGLAADILELVVVDGDRERDLSECA